MNPVSYLVDKETSTIHHYVIDSPQRTDEIDLNKVSWRKMLHMASLNRVLYLFARNIFKSGVQKPPQIAKVLEAILYEGEVYLNKIRNTVLEIRFSLLSRGINFLIIKTYRILPYVTMDIDVLVRPEDFEKAAVALLKKQIEKPKLWPQSYQSQMEKYVKAKGLLAVDLYAFDPGWQLVDVDMVWKNPKEEIIDGLQWPIPSLEAELVLVIAHILHERFQITLLDFLYLKEVSRRADWDAILEQAKKHGWYNSFLRFVSIINEINRILYPDERAALISSELFRRKVTIPRSIVRTSLSMPYVYPINYGFECFFEQMKSGLGMRVLKFAPYYVFALFRYHLTRREKVPIYRHWFPFEKFGV